MNQITKVMAAREYARLLEMTGENLNGLYEQGIEAFSDFEAIPKHFLDESLDAFCAHIVAPRVIARLRLSPC